MATTSSAWPILDGRYIVGDPAAPVAICALTSERLLEPLARLDGVAIAGQVFTANLGIERIVVNLLANPAIRFLLLCGKDSKLFRPGQSLSALLDDGIDDQRRIVGALGYDPVLPELSPTQIEVFRRQIELVDRTGEEDIDTLHTEIVELAARTPGPFTGDPGALPLPAAQPETSGTFVSLHPGGKREPLQYDPKGYFVITLDRDEDQIVVRHYLPNHTPAHEMRGRVAASILLGLIREGLISQLSHAGYLGEELAKAEAALRLELRYDQDRPLRRPPQPAAAPAAPPAPRVTPPLGWSQLAATPAGQTVSVTLAVTDQPSASEFSAAFLEPSAQDPFSSFQRTDHQLAFATTAATTTAMGTLADVVPGTIVRVRGVLGADRRIDAQAVVVLTGVATVQ